MSRRSVAEASRALQAFKKGLPVAVIRGLRKGMPIAKRLALTKYMERKSNQHPFKVNDPANPPPGPLGIRQGNLARTVRIEDVRYNGRTVTASLAAGDVNVRYAKVHELGMTIFPKSGPYLRFPVPTGTGYRMVQATRVVIKPRPFLRPAMEDAEPQVVQIVSKEILTFARAVLKDFMRTR